nr:hypothetical protein Iba_chr15fCG1490 [Ipomoea batatas]
MNASVAGSAGEKDRSRRRSIDLHLNWDTEASAMQCQTVAISSWKTDEKGDLEVSPAFFVPRSTNYSVEYSITAAGERSTVSPRSAPFEVFPIWWLLF